MRTNQGISVSQFQNVIEDFIANVYKERYAKDIDKNLTGTIFSMAVSAFLIGGMVGALSGKKFPIKSILQRRTFTPPGFRQVYGIVLPIASNITSHMSCPEPQLRF